MEPRLIVLCLAMLTLALTSLYYGLKFLKKRNVLLGLEWLVITFSSTNFLVFFLTGFEPSYGVSYFCDAFSRAFGIPVIAIAGLMVLTHGYRPTKAADLKFFVAALLGTAAIIGIPAFAGVLPYFYVLAWSVFSLFLVYFAKRLIDVGEKQQAIVLLLAMASGQAIATIYDFFPIPGGDDNVFFNFFVLAGLSWSFLLAAIDHAYDALERANARSGGRQMARGVVVGV